MDARTLDFVRDWAPPVLLRLFNRATGRAIRFRGRYASWAEAAAAARGYDDDALVRRVECAAGAVRRGEAAWELDGVAYATVPPDFPLLSCLAQAALATGGMLEVLDFGGGLGSSWWQARAHLYGVAALRWHIVEQPAMVAAGRRVFPEGEPTFHESIDGCMRVSTPTLALLSAVLQYLPEPMGVVDRLAAAHIPFLLLDRHPCSRDGRDAITVQDVPASIYRASYPCWLFDDVKFRAALATRFELLAEWDAKDPPIYGRGIVARYAGSFWRRRDA